MSRYDPNSPEPSSPWSSPRGPDAAMGRRATPRRGGPDRLEQGIDRLVSAGRQLVDGVSGARPGSRPMGRGEGRTAGSLPRLEGLGRWVENKLDWILEDEDDWREPWQEAGPGAPMEARPNGQMGPRLEARPDARRDFTAGNPAAGAASTAATTSGAMEPAARRRNRRPLEAVSRRGAAVADQDWPDDDSFLVPRWQRSEPAAPTPTRMPTPTPTATATPTLTPTPTPTPTSTATSSPTPTPTAATAVGRALPRSSRRRQLG